MVEVDVLSACDSVDDDERDKQENRERIYLYITMGYRPRRRALSSQWYARPRPTGEA
jgi:hypothetical protein